MTLPKIALIIPYFGKFPEWMPLYLWSCNQNKMVDFLFYTDCEIPNRTYTNTIFHQMSYEAYCQKVSDALHINFHPQNSYKLCDVKPYYGIIHDDELSNYDWWGWGDIDLVYGDLSLMINEKNLCSYDLLTTHMDRIAGHLTIMKKDSLYTLGGLRIKNWQQKLSMQEHRSMDETEYSRVVMPLSRQIFRKVYGYLERILHIKHQNHFYNKSLWDMITNRFHHHILMKEFFTTFLPMQGTIITYNPLTKSIRVPTGQLTKLPVWGVNYTYTFFSSRRRSIGCLTNTGVLDSTKSQKITISLKAA